MPHLDAHHDLAHPMEGDGAWSESYYFNAYDPPTDTGLFTRIGVRPNEGTMDVGMSLWLPGGELGEHRSVVDCDQMVDTDLAVGPVRYRMDEAMRSWSVTMDGEVTARPVDDPDAAGRPVAVDLDVTFTALSPAVGVDGGGGRSPGSAASAATAASVGKGHLEQAGRWQGHVSLDGDHHEWSDARGNRDKSWGPRRWGGPEMWRWFSINIGDEAAFGGIRIATPSGDLHRGWVWDGEATTSIREWQVHTETAPDGITHRRTEVTALDKAGRAHELSGEVLRVAAIGRRGAGDGPTTIVNEGLTRWTYQGRTGYGIAEYLHQLDEAGRPVVAVA